MIKMFFVRLIIFFCLAVAVFGQITTTADAPTVSTNVTATKDAAATQTTKDAAATLTTKDAAATLTTKDAAATPTTKDAAATPTTKDAAATPTTKDAAATPTTKDAAATPTTKDAAATPTTKDAAATPTTKDAAATPTTKDAAATPTTKDAAATPTTKDAAATITTKDAAATLTTKDAAATITTKDPATTITTKDPAATLTTKDPATTITTKDAAATTTPEPNPCDTNPCFGGSSCQPRNGTNFICLCLAGQLYSFELGLCQEVKVFPGSLNLPGVSFHNQMSNSASEEFNILAEKLHFVMSSIFSEPEYIGSTVLKLSNMGSARTFWSLKSAGVDVSIENNFILRSTINEANITERIKKSIEACTTAKATKCLSDILQSAQYKDVSLCDSSRKPCDDTSTSCISSGGRPNCTCLDNYVKMEYSLRACKACESGKKAEGDVCVDCPFGYSGFNCSESWKLILVIVATVLGALLLVTLILLAVFARKTPMKSSSKKSSKNAEFPTYTSPYPAKDFRASALTNVGVTNASSGFAGIPKIPRAITNNNSLDRGINLEMTGSGSRQALVTREDKGGIADYKNPDDTRNINNRNPYQSGGQGNNPYQSRGQGNNPYQSGGQGNNPYQSGGQGNNPYQSGGQGNNPYQSGGQGNNPYQSGGQGNNPYQSRGQDNPYFTHDNGRRN